MRDDTLSFQPTDLDTAAAPVGIGMCVQCGDLQGEVATPWIIFLYCRDCMKKMAEEQGVTVVTSTEELKEALLNAESNLDKTEDDGGGEGPAG